MADPVATDPDKVQRRLDRAVAKIAVLEGMIEDKTRTLYLAQEELRSQNSFMASVLGSMRSAVIVTDPSGRITEVHGATVQLIQRPESDLVGRALMDLVLLTEAETAPLAELQSAAVQAELDGAAGPVPVLLTISRIAGEDSRGFVVLATDISEQRRLEIELRQAQKLESVGQLAAGIAHEINTPIQFVGDSISFVGEAVGDSLELIRGYRSLREAASAAGVLAGEVDELIRLEEELDIEFVEEEAPRSVERTKDGIRRVAEIVAAMKQFSHPGSGELAPIDLNAIVANTVVVAKNEYKYVAELVTELGEIPEVTGHAGEIGQVLLNIVVNAAHAIADKVGRSGEMGRISISTAVEGDGVALTVTDTGGGVPDEIQDRIFDPFFTTKEPGRGTGQGLAIAHNTVVDRHGGRLDLTVDQGVGSTFTVWLPSA